ncbi:hypothetical protein LTR56_012374 [Elasticomyces elasticus]|nr:hypothetical protein LTR56_012374 [Elasticomyces elasticus]KAK3652334.1 hypothetical protein LTR22_011688 [Elasticomyces elasticus]KAK4918992.1 hypothetical protein LTR49_013309 [Elasticomyces elasticus]
MVFEVTGVVTVRREVGQAKQSKPKDRVQPAEAKLAIFEAIMDIAFREIVDERVTELPPGTPFDLLADKTVCFGYVKVRWVLDEACVQSWVFCEDNLPPENTLMVQRRDVAYPARIPELFVDFVERGRLERLALLLALSTQFGSRRIDVLLADELF